jgi:curved DNA-binding protein CbpA
MQNYYDVLGVSPIADDFVIKAAYKALAQRYHPDKFANNAKDAADAETKMRQLNEAYQVLSDTAKRRDYDASLKQNQQQNSQQSSANSKQQADWQIALRFYPDLTGFETRLAKFDTDLVSEYRSNLLTTQQYEHRQVIANKLEQDYLESYFGDHPDIVEFARELLLAGKREGAKELNQMLKVVGNSVSPEDIIKKIEREYSFIRKTKEKYEEQTIRRKKHEFNNSTNKLKKTTR